MLNLEIDIINEYIPKPIKFIGENTGVQADEIL
jgi:hypothetical protein